VLGGLLAGLIVGYAFGRSDSRDPGRLGGSAPPLARAQEPHRVLTDTRPRSRVLNAHVERNVGPAARFAPDASHEQPPAATVAAAGAAILLARLERAAGGDLSVQVNATMTRLRARHPDVVRQAVWDDALPTGSRSDALRQLVSEDGLREPSYALQLRVLRDHALPSGLRSVAVDGLTEHFEHEEFMRRLPAIRSVWREVREANPSSLVRAVAEQRLGDGWQ